MARRKTQCSLDAVERRVEESLGEYVPVSAKKKEQILKAAARTRAVSLRISEATLAELKRRAAEEGLPYQTLISSVLYKFVTGRLVDASAARR